MLYNVTAFSGGRNDSIIDVYADVDSTRTFDFQIIATVPTAVDLAGFAASNDAAGVRVSWQAASEYGIVGYNVYRRARPGLMSWLTGQGSYEKLNASLILAKGGDYHYLDRTAQPGRTYEYKLEVIVTDSNTRWAGPISITAARPTARPPRP